MASILSVAEAQEIARLLCELPALRDADAGVARLLERVEAEKTTFATLIVELRALVVRH